MGAKYKHFKGPVEIDFMIANSNITVLPDDVGDETIMFLLSFVRGR